MRTTAAYVPYSVSEIVVAVAQVLILGNYQAIYTFRRKLTVYRQLQNRRFSAIHSHSNGVTACLHDNFPCCKSLENFRTTNPRNSGLTNTVGKTVLNILIATARELRKGERPAREHSVVRIAERTSARRRVHRSMTRRLVTANRL